MEPIAKQLANLAKQYHNSENEDDGVKLISLIQDILNNKSLDLTEIVNEVPDYVDDYEVLLTLKYYCQEETSTDIIYDDKDNTYVSTLFVVPLLFQKPARAKIKNIDTNNLLYGELAKVFRKTGVVPEESNVFIYNYLYSPVELLDASFDQVNDIFKSMTLMGLQKTNDLKSLNAIKNKDLNYDKEVFDIRYLLGIKITKEKEDIELDEEKFQHSLENFTTTSSELLSKLFKVQINALTVQDFYDGLEEGLEAYTSIGRRGNIENHLILNNIHPHGVTALIDVDMENIDNSTIKLISKLNDKIIANIDLNSLQFQLPDDLLYLVNDELIESGINREDIFLKMKNKEIPMTMFLDDEILSFATKLH